MAFQRLFTVLVSSSTIFTCLYIRFSPRPLSIPHISLTATLLFTLQSILAIAFNIFIWPSISPLRHLPCAPQKHALRRLLKEPCPWHFEAWTNTVPNNGLIRYYGILNIERVLVTSPEAVKSILHTNVYAFHKQYHQKAYFEKVQGYGLVLQEGNAHKHARKLIGHALGPKRVEMDYWPIIQRKVSQMLKVVSLMASKDILSTKQHDNCPSESKELEIDQLIQRTVFDVSGEVSYGVDFESVLNPEKHYTGLTQYNQAFEGNPATRQRLVLGFLFPKWALDILPISFNWTATAGMRRFKSIGRAYMKNLIPKAAETKASPSVMDELVVGNQMDRGELWEQYLMLLPGALHNTASGILSAVWFLSQPQHAHIQNQLHNELRKDLDTNPLDEPLAAFEKCQYLKAVINEVLRLHPPASWFGREVDTPTVVCDAVLPKGLSVGFSPWAYHRDKTRWGNDADEFKPERWLSPGEARSTGTTTENQSWLTFGAGPRRCVGEALAKAELYCVLGRLFRDFQIGLVDFDRVPRISHHITVAYRDPVRVSVKDLRDE